MIQWARWQDEKALWSHAFKFRLLMSAIMRTHAIDLEWAFRAPSLWISVALLVVVAILTRHVLANCAGSSNLLTGGADAAELLRK